MTKRRSKPEGEPEQGDTSAGRLRFLKGRIGEERATGEAELYGLGELEDDVNQCLRFEVFADEAGIDLFAQSGVVDYTPLMVQRFEERFQSREAPDTSDLQILFDSCSSGYYGGVTGSYSSYEDEHTLGRYREIVTTYEQRQEARGVREAVSRMLGWISPVAAEKIDAAWAASYQGVPAQDFTSGPAMLMRSVLDLAIRDGLLRRTPEPHPGRKRDYLVHVAEHAAISEESAELLKEFAPKYPRLTNDFSAVKGTASLEKERLRTLMHEATAFLHSVLESVDYHRLNDRHSR